MHIQDLRQIQDRYQHVYFSPHFDDVALSCGGAIARHTADGHEVLVVTICGGRPTSGQLTPFAEQLHERWGLAEDPVDVRRQEDLAAVARLRADLYWLPELDAIYRHAAYSSEESIFGAPAADDPLYKTLRRRLTQLIERTRSAVYYFPLAIGGHVDHQIAYQIGCELVENSGTVTFYEDLPYALDPAKLEARLAEVGTSLLPNLVDISLSLARKIGAIGEYRSQIKDLFGSEEQMVEAITLHGTSLGHEGVSCAERLWLRAATQ
jgi:LmbE family N-acetylglucosaminyl deacetylase